MATIIAELVLAVIVRSARSLKGGAKRDTSELIKLSVQPSIGSINSGLSGSFAKESSFERNNIQLLSDCR